jgi:Ni/Co efflux regulator RcnB
MKTQKIVAAIAAASFALGSVSAFAQPRNDQRNQYRTDDRGQYRADDRGRHRADDRGPQRGLQRDDNRRGNRADNRGRGRGAGPDHSFYRGGRLPAQYRSHHYVVNDWRGHRLSAPPRGYHWVQTGGDYVLIAVATGIIASILLSQ